jgi:uncharacterized protein
MSKVLLIGGSGLIGSYVAKHLSAKHEVYILTRQNKVDTALIKYLHWDPINDVISEKALDCEIMINLAGENIAAKRWTTSRKKLLIDSRINPLQFLEKKLRAANKRPAIFIGASAIGYYGDQGDVSLDEGSPRGSGFLSECTVAWEKASLSLASIYNRSAILRIGIVLSTEGGALPELLMTSKFGMLTYFGDMYYAWIHIYDIFGIIDKAIDDDRYHGVINAVSPQPVRNKELVKTMAKALGGKLVIPAPKIAIKCLLGERSDVVLTSACVLPKKLLALNHDFHYGDLNLALADLFKK